MFSGSYGKSDCFPIHIRKTCPKVKDKGRIKDEEQNHGKRGGGAENDRDLPMEQEPGQNYFSYGKKQPRDHPAGNGHSPGNIRIWQYLEDKGKPGHDHDKGKERMKNTDRKQVLGVKNVGNVIPQKNKGSVEQKRDQE